MTPVKRKVEFTPAGRERLERATQEYVDKIESIIADRNFIPGEPMIEGTASDVDQAVRRFVLVERTRSRMISVLVRMYTFVGIFLALAGWFYPTLKNIQTQNPVQFQLIVGGIAIAVLGMIFSLYSTMRYREYRAEDSAPDIAIHHRYLADDLQENQRILDMINRTRIIDPHPREIREAKEAGFPERE
jgi:hypothetical protein